MPNDLGFQSFDEVQSLGSYPEGANRGYQSFDELVALSSGGGDKDKQEEKQTRPKIGAGERLRLSRKQETGDDASTLESVGAQLTLGVQPVVDVIRKSALQQLASGKKKTFFRGEVPFSELPDYEVSNMAKMANLDMPFMDSPLKQWDKTKGAEFADPNERRAERAKFIQSEATNELKRKLQAKMDAGEELSKRDQTVWARLIGGGVENAGYTGAFMRGGVGAVLGSAAKRYGDLQTDEQTLIDGNVETVDKGDAQGTAMSKGAAGGTAEYLIEKYGTEAAGAVLKGTFGKIPFVGAALSKAGGTAVGKTLANVAKKFNRLGEITGKQNLAGEIFSEELPQQIIDAGIGLDKRESAKLMGIGSDTAESFKSFVKPENVGNMALEMLLMQAVQGTAAGVSYYDTYSKDRNRVDGTLAAFGADPDLLKKASLQEKQEVLATLGHKLTPEKATLVLERLGNKAGDLYKGIAEQEGYDFDAKQNGIASKFRLPAPGGGDGRVTLADGSKLYDHKESGIGIVERPDGKVTVYGRDGETEDFKSMGEAVKAANALSVRDQVNDVRRGQKAKFVEATARRLASGVKVQVHNTTEDLLEAVPEVAQSPDYSGDDMPGVAFGDTIHVVLDNIKTPRGVVSTILHEAGVHAGLNNVLKGGEKEQFLKNLGPGAIDKYKRVAGKMGYLEGEHTAEEALAYMYEQRLANPTGFQKGVAWIHDRLRKVNPNYKFTDSDIEVMMADAQRSVRSGAGGSVALPAPEADKGKARAGAEQNAYERKALELEESYPAQSPLSTYDRERGAAPAVAEAPAADLNAESQKRMAEDPQAWIESLRAAKGDIGKAALIYDGVRQDAAAEQAPVAAETDQSGAVRESSTDEVSKTISENQIDSQPHSPAPEVKTADVAQPTPTPLFDDRRDKSGKSGKVRRVEQMGNGKWFAQDTSGEVFDTREEAEHEVLVYNLADTYKVSSVSSPYFSDDNRWRADVTFSNGEVVKGVLHLTSIDAERMAKIFLAERTIPAFQPPSPAPEVKTADVAQPTPTAKKAQAQESPLPSSSETQVSQPDATSPVAWKAEQAASPVAVEPAAEESGSSVELTSSEAREYRSLSKAMGDAKNKGDGERYDRLHDRFEALQDSINKRKAQEPRQDAPGSKAEAPKTPDMDTMVAEARRWSGAALKADGMYDPADTRSRMEHMHITTKGDMDAYLMRKFGISETTARDVSNELTRKNLKPDTSASVEDFKGEPWSDKAMEYAAEASQPVIVAVRDVNGGLVHVDKAQLDDPGRQRLRIYDKDGKDWDKRKHERYGLIHRSNIIGQSKPEDLLPGTAEDIVTIKALEAGGFRLPKEQPRDKSEERKATISAWKNGLRPYKTENGEVVPGWKEAANGLLDVPMVGVIWARPSKARAADIKVKLPSERKAEAQEKADAEAKAERAAFDAAVKARFWATGTNRLRADKAKAVKDGEELKKIGGEFERMWLAEKAKADRMKAAGRVKALAEAVGREDAAAVVEAKPVISEMDMPTQPLTWPQFIQVGNTAVRGVSRADFDTRLAEIAPMVDKKDVERARALVDAWEKRDREVSAPAKQTTDKGTPRSEKERLVPAETAPTGKQALQVQSPSAAADTAPSVSKIVSKENGREIGVSVEKVDNPVLDALRKEVEEKIARGEKVPIDTLEKFPWLAADEAIKPYVQSLAGMSDKQLQKEEKKAADELNRFADNNKAIMPDGTPNPALGNRAYFEVSNKLTAIDREIKRRSGEVIVTKKELDAGKDTPNVASATPDVSTATASPAVKVETEPDGDKTVSVPKADKPSIQPKEQKKFLLAEIDKALEMAPDNAEAFPRTKEADEAQADYLGIVAENYPLGNKPSMPYNANDEQKAEHADKMLAYETMVANKLDPLFEKYGIPEMSPERKGYLSIEGTTEGAVASSKYDIGVRYEILKARLDALRNDKYPTITIEVPGDGEFTVINDKAHLSVFRDMAKKRFPASMFEPAANEKKALPEPHAPVRLGRTVGFDAMTAEIKGLLQPFASTDQTRKPLLNPHWNGAAGEAVATDGRRLAVMIGKKNAKPKKDDSGYPNYTQVVPGYKEGKVPNPDPADALAVKVDSAKLTRKLIQALAVYKDFDKAAPSVKLWLTADGSLEVSTDVVDTGSYSSLREVGDGFEIGIYNPEYLMDALTFLRKTGNETPVMRVGGRGSPMLLNGKSEYVVQMPLRMDGTGRANDTHVEEYAKWKAGKEAGAKAEEAKPAAEAAAALDRKGRTPDQVAVLKKTAESVKASGGESAPTKTETAKQDGVADFVAAEIPKSPDGDYQIYIAKVKTPDGSYVDRFAVPDRDHKNKPGFGDSLHATLEEAVKEAQNKRTRDVEEVKRNAEADAAKRKAAEAKAVEDDVDGFDAGMTPMQRGKAIQELNAQVNLDGNVTTRKTFIRRAVKNGTAKPEADERDVVAEWSRTKLNRASQEEQNAYYKRRAEGGKKTVYLVGGYNLGHTAFKYANHLIAKSSGESALPKPAAQAETTDTPKPESAERKEAKQAPGKLEDFGEKIGGARKDVAERGFTMSGKKADKEDATPAWRKKYVAMEKIDGTGWTVGKSGDKWGISTMRGQLFATEAEADAAIPIYAVAEAHSVYQNKDGKWEIFKRVGDRKRLKVVNKEFDSREDAMTHMAQHAEELLNLKTSFGEEILPVPEIARRSGVPRRTKDATPEMFMDTFAPRGIEFGNWNNQEERQMVMNHAYDGLMDLAETLGLPPKALMLDGDLAIAFGARGHGLSSAKAHYELDYGVINLTKMSGAGSLAHEWMHALDHYLARLDSKAKSEKKANARGDMVYPVKSDKYDMQSHGYSYNSKLREELKQSYRSLVESLFRKAKKYVEDTTVADKFLKTAKEHLRDRLNDVRADLARDMTGYHKSKGGYSGKPIKFFQPASAEQLAEFDRLADSLVEGGNLETAFRYNTEDRPGEKPKRWSRSAFGRVMAGRHTNDTLEAISAIVKAARNRSGFMADQNGPLDKVRAAMTTYSARIKMMESAEAGEEKERMGATDYAIEARKMDQARSGDYWSEPHEMVARAFASYVEDKIAEKGGASEFLVYRAHGGIILPMIDGFVARPYPEGKEREAINGMFDAFVKEIKTKETGRGVAMFRRSDEEIEALRKKDAEYMDAVERGDMETAQRMVDEAAKAAGYTTVGYHGTNSRAFSEFNESPIFGKAWFFSDTPEYPTIRGVRVMTVMLAIRNTKNVKISTNQPWSVPSFEKGILDKAKDEGYDSVRLIAVPPTWMRIVLPLIGLRAEVTGYNNATVVFDPSQIKSADPVTRDDAGNVIPLSQRFNDDSNDIRFRRSDEEIEALRKKDAEYMDAVERGDMETAQRMVDEAAQRAGYTVGPVYHGTDAEFNRFKGDSWFAVSEDLASVGGVKTPSRIIPAYLKGDFRRASEDEMVEMDDAMSRSVKSPDAANAVGSRILDEASDEGYDGVLFPKYAYIVRNPSAIKSADPATRDDAGNVVPLSQRFNAETPDIRFRRSDAEIEALLAEIEREDVAQNFRALPSTDPKARDMQADVQISYAYNLTPATVQQMQDDARGVYEKDRKQAQLDLLAGRTDSGIVNTDARRMATDKIAVDDMTMDAVNSPDDEGKAATAMLAIWRWYERGTDVARALRMRFDPVDTPEGRRAWIMRTLLAPTRAEAEIIRRAKTTNEAISALKAKAKHARAALKILRAKNIDISKLTADQLMDDVYVAKIMQDISAARSGWGDVVHEWWRNAILSAPTSPLVNTVGNAGNAALEAFIQRPVEALINTYFKNDRAATFRSIGAMYRAIITSMNAANNNFLKAWATEKPVTGDSAKVEESDAAIPDRFGGKIVRIPQRVMLATDEWFKTVFMAMLTADYATREFDRLVNEGKQQEANREAYVLAQVHKDSSAYAKAWEETLRWSFQQKPGHMAGAIMNWRNDPDFGFWLKFIFPFVKTPANIISSGLRKTPLNAVPYLYKASTGKYSQEDAFRLGAEQAVGMVFMSLIYMMMKGDDDDPLDRPRITGTRKASAFSPKGMKEAEMRDYPPMSVRVGDRWVSYKRLEPFATMASTMVDALTVWEQATSGHAEDIPAAVFSSIRGNLSDKTFLQGVGNLVSIMEGDELAMSRAVTGTLAGFNPNIVRSTVRAFDPYIRETRTQERGAVKKFAAKLSYQAFPSASNAPEPKIGKDGQPVEREGGAAYNALVPFSVQAADKTTKADAMIKRFNERAPKDQRWWPSSPEPSDVSFGKEKIRMTDEEHAEYKRVAGKIAERRLSAVSFNYANPTERDRDRMKKIYEDSRSAARDRMRPAVIRRWKAERAVEGKGE